MPQIDWYQMSYDQRSALVNRVGGRDWPNLMRNLNRHLGRESKPREWDLTDPIDYELFKAAVACRVMLQMLDKRKRTR
jgi:hypothetical protein